MSATHAHTPTADEVRLPAGSLWTRMPIAGGLLAFLGLVLSLAFGFGGHRQEMAFGMLIGMTYFGTIAMGGMFFVLIQFATKAGWSVTLRRIAESLMFALPFVAVGLFLVFGLGLGELYHWADVEHASHDPVLAKKVGYLNPGFFWVRNIVYLVSWTGIAFFFHRNSVAQDQSKDPEVTRRLQAASYPMLAVYALTVSFAGIDWLKTLDPHWFSTMWGVYFFAGSAVSGFAAIALVAVRLRQMGAVSEQVITTEHLHDIGKLVFAFTVFWTYIAFSQYMLYWYGNIPEETIYYQHRQGGWSGWTHFLAVGHFAIPFFFLMSRHVKRNPKTLLLGAAWILFMHYVDIVWIVMPVLHADGPSFGLLDLSGMLLFGGLFLLGLGLALNRNALVAVGDPRLKESLAFQNF